MRTTKRSKTYRPKPKIISRRTLEMENGSGSGTAAEGAVVGRLMAAKRHSGKNYSQIATETGLTNVYVAQLLRRQAQLKPGTADALRAAIPALTDDLVAEMMAPPFRSFRPDLVHEPAVYRSVSLTLLPSYCLFLILLTPVFAFADLLMVDHGVYGLN